ncbi:hypothetical protein F6J84_02555 [Microbacterium caowuchunii]|uniref:hypothetical protein n=1 Tax=Microbacterium caowuchunii TaxID=2614638 RepID=UPI00124664E1|nr:hypothetical protein [Microbacterium caowuchunii]QEV99104.1 hypothetical protein F6J84_02555 [Microbacterium caowuchunii]
MRKLVASAAAALLIGASPLMLGASAANAADGAGFTLTASAANVAEGAEITLDAPAANVGVNAVCVPSEAWTETVVITPEVPAVPAIPAVPEIPEISHIEIVVIQEAWTETVIDKEAWDEEVFDHWQHYSWTGGPHTSDSAPTFPSGDWQANVQGDPHGIGVAGAYFRSHGNAGNGDWFYLEAVTKTVHHEAETHTVEHPAVTEEVKVVDQEYVPGIPGVPGKPAIPAVTEEIQHPAVECTATPAVITKTKTTAAAEKAAPAQPTALAVTGTNAGLPVLFGGAGALALGLLLMGIRRFARE